jgi:DNA-binding MarR family transcriptional regulator/predicted N-acetyltransferase YhbS
MDAIEELGALGLASRLKRLSDYLYREVAHVYRDLGAGMEPRWFPVLHLLSVRAPLSITEIADELRLTHAAVNQTAGTMELRGLVRSRKGRPDGRRRILILSRKGHRLVERLRPVWNTIRSRAEELIDEAGVDLLAALDRMEESLSHRSYYERIAESIPELRERTVEIVEYRPAYKKHFRSLNLEWLETELTVEPPDERLLSDPSGQILRKGGRILFARTPSGVVGTVALIRLDARTFELGKMAVTERARGRGIGRCLAVAALALARELDAETVVLHTVPKLVAAGRLYESLGFVLDPAGEHEDTGYERKTIRMVKKLRPAQRRRSGPTPEPSRRRTRSRIANGV